MAEKEGRRTLSVIREFAKTPNRSMGVARRVLVDSMGNEVVKTPRKYSGTPVKSFSVLQQGRISSASNTPCRTQGRISSACNTPCRTPCRNQASPSISCQKEEESYVLQNSDLVTGKENIVVLTKDEIADKENIPMKRKISHEEGTTSGRTPILSLRKLRSELSRFQNRANLLRSPAMRVEVKDATEGYGKEKKSSASKNNDPVRKKLDVSSVSDKKKPQVSRQLL